MKAKGVPKQMPLPHVTLLISCKIPVRVALHSLEELVRHLSVGIALRIPVTHLLPTRCRRGIVSIGCSTPDRAVAVRLLLRTKEIQVRTRGKS